MKDINKQNDIGTSQESRFLISDLCDLLSQYMDSEQVKEVYRAYLFGAQAHEGQVRVSGEPYILPSHCSRAYPGAHAHGC